MSQKYFSVEVVEGDYFLRSDFGVVARTGADIGADVVTMYFLFDRNDRLKDVVADIWTDGI